MTEGVTFVNPSHVTTLGNVAVTSTQAENSFLGRMQS
jgi:hypothetical protein